MIQLLSRSHGEKMKENNSVEKALDVSETHENKKCVS